MAFVARSRASIRDSLLADWASRYTALGTPLLTVVGSDAYMLADALAVELELFEQQALILTKAILPDQADTDSLERHGLVEGIDRDPAIGATLRVAITGTPSTTITFGSSVLTYGGVSYANFKNGTTGAALTSVSLNGSGNTSVPVNATATSTGASTTVAASTTLTWSSTPTNANATATVTSVIAPGEDAETDESYAERIIDRRQERPASGNRSDWADWCERVDGVEEAYVYPLWHQTYGTGTRGAVTVVVIGPPQGTATSNTKILTGGTIEATVAAYIEGTQDIHGDTVDGEQLRPVTIESGSYVILPATESVQAVTIVLIMASDAPFPWTSPASYTVTAYNTGTREITLSADPVEVTAGDTIAVRDIAVRGLYSYGMVSAVNHGTNVVTMDSAFTPASVDTAASGRIRPVPQTATSIRDAIFDYFDSLTPGNTSPASRWPIVDSSHPTVVYRPALVAAAISNSGGSVLSASVTTPSGDLTPAARQLYTLGELILSA